MPDRSSEKKISPQNVFLWALTLSAIAIGIYLRLKGIDKAPFTIDEYYIAASVQNIVEKGIPEFSCGGYYTRGIFYQYLLAPLFAFGTNDELFARLITVFSNILAAPALYLLAKQISGRTVAYGVIILFFLSVWEIEFSRFARMYAPFQLIFIWYLYFLYKWTLLDDKNAKFWCYSLSLLSIFVYEGGVFLILLNFLPPFIRHKHFQFSSIAISTALLAIAYSYLTHNFRFTSAETMTRVSEPFITLPPIMADTLSYGSIWFVLYLALSLMMFFFGILLIKKLYTEKNHEHAAYKAILILLFILFALLNAYTLIASTLIIALALNLITTEDLIRRKHLPVSASIMLMLGFWITYGMLTDDWISAVGPEKQASAKQLLIALFKYPDIFGKLIHVFIQTMPFFTVSVTLILAIGVIDAAYSDRKTKSAFFFLLAILIILIMLISILRQPYISTRYFFFLYPIIILLVTLTFHNILTRFNAPYPQIIVAPILLFMFISEDYLLNHYMNINSDEITYRITYDEAMTNHLYAKWDYRSPAEVINNNSATSDIVIAATYAAPYYLDKIDYFYHDQNRDNYTNILGCNDERSLWVDADLISQPDKLLSIINDSDNTVWLIALSSQYKWASAIEKQIDHNYSKNIIYNSVDGNINVYEFPPKNKPKRLSTDNLKH